MSGPRPLAPGSCRGGSRSFAREAEGRTEAASPEALAPRVGRVLPRRVELALTPPRRRVGVGPGERGGRAGAGVAGCVQKHLPRVI